MTSQYSRVSKIYSKNPLRLPDSVPISFMIYFRNSQNIFTNKLDSAIDTFMFDSFGELGIANRYNWKLQMQWLILTDKRNQF